MPFCLWAPLPEPGRPNSRAHMIDVETEDYDGRHEIDGPIDT